MGKQNFDEEILSLEELDGVSGGSLKEMYSDIEFLHAVGFNIELRSSQYIYSYFKEVSRELRATWGQAGVRCKTLSNGDYTRNVYTDTSGSVITREEAMAKAMEFKKNKSIDINKYIVR